jgi:hypothetical protein
MIKKIASALLVVVGCVSCIRASPRSLGVYRWGYLVAGGPIVIGRPLTAHGGKCAAFIDKMETCYFLDVSTPDSAWVMALVRHDRVYHVEVHTHPRDPRRFYAHLVATFGDPATAPKAGPLTRLYWQDATTCAIVNPADPREIRETITLQMWDGRERGDCGFQ